MFPNWKSRMFVYGWSSLDSGLREMKRHRGSDSPEVDIEDALRLTKKSKPSSDIKPTSE